MPVIAGGGGDFPNIGARVYNSGALTITTATHTVLTFDSTRWDTDTIHNPGVNPERLTATTAGTYLIVGNILWAASATGVRHLRIRLNGGDSIALTGANPGTGYGRDQPGQNISAIYELAATDYVTLSVYQNSGGNLGVSATAQETPEFMMQRIGA